MADKITEALVDALKQAIAEPSAQCLFRSGKLAGLFPGRGGVPGEAAAQALHTGLLEVVRTETKGKTISEWVRPTPKGVDFVHEHESPIQVLKELQTALQMTREGIPVWLADMRENLHALAERVAQDAQQWVQRLENLSQRVEQALRQIENSAPLVSDSLVALVPWAADAVSYLERRHACGAADHCPLPELFTALAAKHADLSIGVFHDGLRHLQEHRVLRLLPLTTPPAELSQPEYALLNGGNVLYYARR